MSFSSEDIRKFQALPGPAKRALGFLWRRYWNLVQNTNNFGFLVLLRNPVSAFLTHKMLWNLRRFNSNLDHKELKKAVGIFSKLNFQAGQPLGPVGNSTVIMGWEEFQDCKAFGSHNFSIKISRKRVIRPDVAFVKGDFDLICSGFRMEISHTSSNLPKSDFNQFIKELLRIPGLHIDSITPKTPVKSNNSLPALFLRYPSEIAQILEATNSSELSLTILKSISRIISVNLNSDILLSAVKLSLVAGEKGHSFARDLGFEVRRRIELLPMLAKEPKSAFVHVPNVQIQDGDSLLEGNTLIEFDPVQNPSFDFVAGKWDSVVGTHLDNRFAAVKMRVADPNLHSSGILMSSRADFNWFHWLIETLPRISRINETFDLSVPIVISDSIPETAKESLKLITRREILEVSRWARHSFTNLYVPSPVLFHPDSPNLWMGKDFHLLDREALLALRQKVLESPFRSNSGFDFERIFIPRKNANRSLINRKKISSKLRKIGFKEVELASLSFTKQVEVFNRAKIIVFEGGATMSNLIFCSAGTNVIVLVGKSLEQYHLPVILGEIAGTKTKIITGNESRAQYLGSFSSKIHSSYKISSRKLLKEIQKLLVSDGG
jgi:Glycosyltransferase 61